MPVGVELSLVQVGGVDSDVHHLLLRLALRQVVDSRHWERPLIPDAQTYLWDFKVSTFCIVFAKPSDILSIKDTDYVMLSPGISSFESKTHSTEPVSI